MKNELIEKSKELIMTSQIGKYVGEENVDKALKQICILNSKAELYRTYKEKTGVEYDGYLAGFNNAGISYFLKDSEPHAVIHEILHTLSSTFDENGRRTKNGIAEKNIGFENQLNEGLTEYLTYKVTGNYTNMYVEGKGLFKGIEESFNKYSCDENALLKIYFENNPHSLEQFFNESIPKKSMEKFIKNNFKSQNAKQKIEELKHIESFEYIYKNLLFFKSEQIDNLALAINEGTKKVLKNREMEQKHPLLFKIKNKILGKKNIKLMLPENKSYDDGCIREEIEDLSKTIEEIAKERESENQKIYKNIDEKDIEDIIVR